MALGKLGRLLAPSAIKQRLRSLSRHGRQGYRRITLTDGDIDSGAYAQHLGGGPAAWDRRGAFQLGLLRRLGLSPQHDLLDVGCGPLRAGIHLIDYLEAGRYAALDYNPDFIKAAEHVVDSQGLRDKRPQLLHLESFDFGRFDRVFDFAIAFSVLNHCNGHQREVFFDRIGPAMKPGGRVLITHATWFDESFLAERPLELEQTLLPDSPELADMPITDWGWERPDEIFPILSLVRT